MRLVLDTNVVVSALLWGGEPLRLFGYAADGTVTLHTSPVLLGELGEVLTRSHLAERLVSQQRDIAEALAHYAEMSVVVAPEAVPRVVPDDPDDDEVIAAAVAAQATAIVSGDKDLLRLGNHEAEHGEIAILTVAEALARIGPLP